MKIKELKEILLKRLEDETNYEDAYGDKDIITVIDEVFNEAEQEQLRLQNVVNRREQLLAFAKWFIREENINSTRPDTYVDDFLESQ